MSINLSKNSYILIFILVILISVLFIAPILAQGAVNNPANGPTNNPTTSKFDNPLGAGVDIYKIIANVVKTILGLVGIAALVMFIYGGGLWMTSAGNTERISKGRETLVWASLGLAVIFGSYALVNLVLSAFEVTT